MVLYAVYVEMIQLSGIWCCMHYAVYVEMIQFSGIWCCMQCMLR